MLSYKKSKKLKKNITIIFLSFFNAVYFDWKLCKNNIFKNF